MIDLNELKKLAEAVPELPWEVTGHTVYALEHDGWRKGVEQMRNRFSFSVQRGPETPESELQAIAEFCQAANPAAVLELIAMALAAAPQVVADERKPFAFVIVDKDRNPQFVAPDWNSAQEHINDACEMSIENAGKWKAIPAFEMRPTDDKLWDETMKDRDQYQEWADKLAEAIALHFGADIGEHSNMNCPWAEALEIIEQVAPVQAQEPVAVVYPPDGTVSPFTVINLGHGLVKMGDSLHDGRLPALWFGKDGLGMGVAEEMNRAAKEGETLAVVTFANVEGLDVLSEVVRRIRSASFPGAPVQPVAVLDGKYGRLTGDNIAQPVQMKVETK